MSTNYDVELTLEELMDIATVATWFNEYKMANLSKPSLAEYIKWKNQMVDQLQDNLVTVRSTEKNTFKWIQDQIEYVYARSQPRDSELIAAIQRVKRLCDAVGSGNFNYIRHKSRRGLSTQETFGKLFQTS